MEDHSPEHDVLAHHLPSIAEEEDYDMEEHCQQYILMTISGWKGLFQRGICAYMKMPIHVHMA